MYMKLTSSFQTCRGTGGRPRLIMSSHSVIPLSWTTFWTKAAMIWAYLVSFRSRLQPGSVKTEKSYPLCRILYPRKTIKKPESFAIGWFLIYVQQEWISPSQANMPQRCPQSMANPSSELSSQARVPQSHSLISIIGAIIGLQTANGSPVGLSKYYFNNAWSRSILTLAYCQSRSNWTLKDSVFRCKCTVNRTNSGSFQPCFVRFQVCFNLFFYEMTMNQTWIVGIQVYLWPNWQ